MTVKIVVAAALCTPTRTHIRAALDDYGVRYKIGAEYWGDLVGQPLRGASEMYLQVAEVLVSEAAAKWTEYLLLRTNKLRLISKPLDKRNLQWALKWGGAMPKPWVEPGCNPGAHRPARRKPERRERYR